MRMPERCSCVPSSVAVTLPAGVADCLPGFLNSVLLVEAMERLELFKEKKKGEISVKLTNPTSKDNNFIINLKAINGIHGKENLTFSKWILSCPFWKFYLKKEFECSATAAKGGEVAFRQFIGATVLTKKSYPHDLNIKLDKISVNIFETKDGNKGNGSQKTNASAENVSSKIEALVTSTIPGTKSLSLQGKVLKRFLGNVANTKDVFLEKCKKDKLTNEKIRAMSAAEILAFMRKHLRDVYTRQSLNIQRAERVKRKIAKGEWSL